MNAFSKISSAAIFLATIVTAHADDLPQPLAFARYQGMLDHSPFAVATAVTPPPAAPDFAKDLYIANAARSADGDLITLASNSDKNFKEYLTSKEPIHGYSISNVEWSDKVGATKVTISKEGQFATLGFNQALLSSAPNPGQQMPNMPPNPQLPMPNQPLQIPQAPLPLARPAPTPALPQLPTPPPRIRSIIPRNPPVAPPR